MKNTRYLLFPQTSGPGMKIFGVVNLNQSTSNEESGCGLVSSAQEYLGYPVLLHKNVDQNEGHETSIA